MKFPLEQVLRLQEEFARLYSVTGLIAVNKDYIHVTPGCLAELSDKSFWDLEQYEGRVHADVWLHGIKFTTCMTADEVLEVGLELPE